MKELLVNYEIFEQIKRYKKANPVFSKHILESFIRNSGYTIEELEERGMCCFGVSDKGESEEIFWNGYCLRFHILPEPEDLKTIRHVKKVISEADREYAKKPGYLKDLGTKKRWNGCKWIRV